MSPITNGKRRTANPYDAQRGRERRHAEDLLMKDMTSTVYLYDDTFVAFTYIEREGKHCRASREREIHFADEGSQHYYRKYLRRVWVHIRVDTIPTSSTV